MIRKAYKMMPRAGNMGNLKLIEEDLNKPGPEEVTVAIKSIGLNFADIFAIFGLYSATPKGPFIPGLEFAGEIMDVGSEVSDYKKGDKVMGVTRFGGYSNFLNISYHYIIPLPDTWSYEEGSSYMIQAFTAYYGLVILGNIQEGQTILIHSAAGGVGLLANRLAKKYGAYTIGSIGSDKKVELLKQEDYDDYIVRSENFREDLRKSLGERELNIVMECIGGQIFKDGFRLLAPEGRMIVYGAANFASPGKRPNYFKILKEYWNRPKLDPMRMVEWNKSVMSFNLIHLWNKKEYIKKYLDHLNELNLGKPIIGHKFEFDNLVEAVRTFQAGHTMGKVVVTV